MVGKLENSDLVAFAEVLLACMLSTPSLGVNYLVSECKLNKFIINFKAFLDSGVVEVLKRFVVDGDASNLASWRNVLADAGLHAVEVAVSGVER